MWIWMQTLAIAQPVDPAASPSVEVTVMAAKDDTEVVAFDKLRELRKNEAMCTAPCTIELPPGRHRLGTRRGRWLAATRLKLEPGDGPVTLKSRPTKLWALITYGALQSAAGLAIATSAVPDNCYLYDWGGVLENPTAAASCRAKASRQRTSAFTTAGVLTASALPFLVVSMPSLRPVRRRSSRRNATPSQ